jgi:hypothetical protein
MHAHVHASTPLAGQYFLMVRQSIDGSSSVSKPHLLASLVAVASASARLHQRTTVLECPDAALAVVLMEQSLANKVAFCGWAQTILSTLTVSSVLASRTNRSPAASDAAFLRQNSGAGKALSPCLLHSLLAAAG